ncbi:MAG: hypothetical protein WAZ18_06760 [Alphaproteobacteria bacterium]
MAFVEFKLMCENTQDYRILEGALKRDGWKLEGKVGGFQPQFSSTALTLDQARATLAQYADMGFLSNMEPVGQQVDIH